MIGIIGALVWIYLADDDPQDVAETIQVDIPSGASGVVARGEGLEYKGNCADVEFLIPDAEWKGYVAQYFAVDQILPRYGPRASCGGERTICDEREYVAGQSGFVASDRIVDDGGAYARTLAVVPSCKPGLTRISWRVSR
ncbi:MAG TPA: hypothetical protein VIQ49_18680 [Williamsia sp.]